MAVYTVLEREQIEELVKPYGIGPLVDFQGVSEGIENTSYFLTTDHSQLANEDLTDPIQHYVLTLFEELTPHELPFYVELTTALNQAELPIPCPLTDYNGQAIQRIANKPALLFPKIAGRHPGSVSPQQCKTLGQTLAHMHLVTQDLPLHHAGNRDIEWLKNTAAKVSTVVDPKEQTIIKEEMDNYISLIEQQPKLSEGIVHNDLFRDNTLFEGDSLTAVIDFYNASSGYLLLDVAIVVNDWCSEADGSLDMELCQALLDAYASIRPFSEQEKTHWNTFLRICALPFLVVTSKYPALSAE